jgi:hypothetical protein
VSQTLIRDVIYAGSQDVEEVVFRTLRFKIFNKIEAWEYMVQVLGERPSWTGYEFATYDRSPPRCDAASGSTRRPTSSEFQQYPRTYQFRLIVGY